MCNPSGVGGGEVGGFLGGTGGGANGGMGSDGGDGVSGGGEGGVEGDKGGAGGVGGAGGAGGAEGDMRGYIDTSVSVKYPASVALLRTVTTPGPAALFALWSHMSTKGPGVGDDDACAQRVDAASKLSADMFTPLTSTSKSPRRSAYSATLLWTAT